MSTEVVMPQMGESIAEGTITKWLKKVGERVERDEPLFEISTDKVDAEIPSPAAGTLTEIRFKEGDTVEVNTVVAVLDGDQSAASAAAAPKPAEEEPAPEHPEASPATTAGTSGSTPQPHNRQLRHRLLQRDQRQRHLPPARRHRRPNRMAQLRLLTNCAARSRARWSARSHKSTAWTFRDSKALV